MNLFASHPVACPAADWCPAIVRNHWNPTHLHLVFCERSQPEWDFNSRSPLRDADGWESDVDPWAMMARGYRFLSKCMGVWKARQGVAA